MNKPVFLSLIISMVTILNKSLAQKHNKAQFDWSKLPPIPDHIGFAGSFTGVADEALIVAGGANFPDGGAPWTGSVKAWSDQIFVLENPGRQWKAAGRLPQRLGYGASVNYKNSLILLGGSNEKGHYSSVLMLRYRNASIQITNLPDLPQPIANTCGILIGTVIYVMGGMIAPDAKTAADNFWALDLSKDQKEWKVLKSWPGSGRMLSVAGAQNGSVYLFSGVTLVRGQRQYLKDAYAYSDTAGWKKIADLPRSVAAAPTPAFAYGEKQLMIFGGDDGVEAPNAAVLKERHPGFSKEILCYDITSNGWSNAGDIHTAKRADAVANPNQSTWAPVTTTLTVWKGNVILPGGEVRPATRTPNVLTAKPKKESIK